MVAGQFGGCWTIRCLQKIKHLIAQQPPNCPGPPAPAPEIEKSESVFDISVDSPLNCDRFELKTRLATRKEPDLIRNRFAAALVSDAGALDN